jgi:LuxR family transcriptional regulator, maltose regulon positive regulatory protein
MTAIGAAPSQAIGSRPQRRTTSRPDDATAGRRASPAQAPGVVVRDALVERLMAAQGLPLALLVAPAGYGKTTLLAQWGARDPRPFAVVRLRRADDDPLELVRSISRGLSAGVPELRDELKASARALHRRSLYTSTRALESAVAEASEPFVLVLDNGEVLGSDESLSVLETLVETVGPDGQIVFSSRQQPPSPISRLRAERRLIELGTADFVLTRSEVADVAAGAGLALDGPACDLLAQRTEGWAAGVYLAALALGDESSPDEALAGFGGDDRLVVDYVRDELLAGLPAALIEFMARSSIMTRLSGPLCDYVLEREDSAQLLRKLSRMNVLVVPLDRTDTEYRYHALLAESLRSELRLREPGLEPLLHARASHWHELHGEPGLAIEHALRADDLARAGRLLCDATPEMLGYGRTTLLSRRLNHFTREQISACAPLALSAAALHFVLGDRALAEHWTTTAASATGAGEDPVALGLHLLRAAVSVDDVDAMRRDAARAYELAANESPWGSFACFLEGTALRLGGDPTRARERLEEGARRGVALAPAVQALCLAELGLLAIDESDWDGAAARIAIARAQIDRVGLDDCPLTALVFAVSAAVNAQLGRPEISEREARRAERLLGLLTGFSPWYTAQCRIALASAALRLSDVGRARHLLADATRDLRDLRAGKVAHTSLRACRDQVEAVSAARTNNAEQLTTAELRVLQFLPTHLSFPEIADELYVSRNTVKTHVRAVYRKLMASSRSEAVQHARDAGLLETLAAL